MLTKWLQIFGYGILKVPFVMLHQQLYSQVAFNAHTWSSQPPTSILPPYHSDNMISNFKMSPLWPENSLSGSLKATRCIEYI